MNTTSDQHTDAAEQDVSRVAPVASSRLPDITRRDVGAVLVSEWIVRAPERQRALGDAFAARWAHAPWPHGLLSCNLFASTDGERVLNYAQWTSDEACHDFVRVHRTPRVDRIDRAVPGLERIAPVTYRLTASSEVSPAGRQSNHVCEETRMSDNNHLHVAIIVGSTREGRFAPTVANWFAGHAKRRDDMVVDVIDLAETRFPDVLTDKPAPEVAAVSPRLARADAFVIVTPEYNHSFPAPLKTAIDWYSKEWQAKPVGFVSYGGASGGLRAVEQLRQVFAELHAVTVRDTVSFRGVWSQFDSEGRPKDTDSCERAARAMLDQLAWWGHALRNARTKRPYAA